jgi:hypothetical protein
MNIRGGSTAMRSIWLPLLAVLLFLGVAACQAVAKETPLMVNTNGTGGSALSLTVTQPQDESVVRSNPIMVSGSVSGAVEVRINGSLADSEGGHFSVMVELETGPNSIEITARDTAGKQLSKYVSVVYVPQ